MDQWDGEQCAMTVLKRLLMSLRVFIRFGEDVRDMRRSPVDDRTRCNKSMHEGKVNCPTGPVVGI